jgi:MFS family permease
VKVSSQRFPVPGSGGSAQPPRHRGKGDRLDDLVAEGLMGGLVSLALGTVLCGVIGAVIGDRRGRRMQGLLLGLLLGPVGWVWVAAAPSRKGAPQLDAASAAQLGSVARLAPTGSPPPSQLAVAAVPPAHRGLATGIPVRPCPACAREIPAAAVKCRHCGARSAAATDAT